MTSRHHLMRFRAPAHAIEGMCGVSIFQTRPDAAVVVLTEVEGNPGDSVTNAVEHAANKAKRAFLPNVSSEQVIWVERYEKTGSLLVGGTFHEGETFDLVVFKVGENGYTSPAWHPLGERNAASFWKILFQSDKPRDAFPNFAEAGASMR